MVLTSILGASLALFQAVGTPASAAIIDDERARLDACIERIETDPETAYEDGLAWIGQGSRPNARHCVALALIGLGETEAGAAQLETLANAPDAGSLETRALYLAQSGNAWLAAGYPEAAITTLGNAILISAYDAELHKDRAAAYLALERWDEARADLDEALGIAPDDSDALGLRARALLGLEEHEAALADVEAARIVEPDNIDLLVLRGDIREARRLAGD